MFGNVFIPPVFWDETRLWFFMVAAIPRGTRSKRMPLARIKTFFFVMGSGWDLEKIEEGGSSLVRWITSCG